ncbi:hypothetical protein TD95_003052 [Thielaviopsis punctulata]|uniref:ACB domain-containing protein n=1 Tax=Thielaviopsis punctulata TaxID=72032 RepID=A0A0F4ZJP1_9PEZI|nr:hypothetical protein TD95_003052 [Thielaviopsis punctulata]
MADSIDRVFVHALGALKQMPKTGSAKPPVDDRLRLYGLYKQAMEGDVDGVMDRPSKAVGITKEELKREQGKWDAWNSQKSLSRTEAKRKYVEALIEILNRYATTTSGKELVSELEFVWDQVKNNAPSLSDTAPFVDSQQLLPIEADDEAVAADSSEPMPLKVLRPMSEVDEAERQSERRLIHDAEFDDDDDPDNNDQDDASVISGRWARRVEKALVKLSTEVVALREQISTAREWRARKAMTFRAWAEWFVWLVAKHVAADVVVTCVVLIWMRRRGDRRLEDLVRGILRLAREYVRKIVPSR